MSTLHGHSKTSEPSPAENLFSWAGENTDQISLSEDKNEKKTIFTSEKPSLDYKLWDNRATLKSITAQYAICYLDSTIKNKFFAQIDWLLNVEHWVADDKVVDIESFKTLVRFILNSKPHKAPYLGLADNGNISASWINDLNKITLECLPQNNFKWFISCTFNGKKERVGGEAPSLERLLATIKPFEKAGWFSY